MGLVKTRRLMAMQKQTTYAKATEVRQRAKAGMKPPTGKFPRNMPGKSTKVSATRKYG